MHDSTKRSLFRTREKEQSYERFSFQLDDAIRGNARKTIGRIAWIAFVASLATFILLHVLAIAKWEPSRVVDALGEVEVAKFLSATFISLFTSVLAAMVYTNLQNRGVESRLSLIRSLGDSKLLYSLLSDVKHYEGRTLSNYHANVTLRRSPYPDALICQIDYNYCTTNKPSHLLRFGFNRVTGVHDATRTKTTEALPADDVYYTYEFQYTLDETTLAPLIPSDALDALYKVRSLSVAGVATELRAVRAEYEAIIPDTLSLEEPLAISYTVEFPLELDSFVSVMLELPASDLYCKFDYRDVIELVEVYANDFIGTRKPVLPSPGINGEIIFNHRNWIFPRSGISFMWWRVRDGSLRS